MFNREYIFKGPFSIAMLVSQGVLEVFTLAVFGQEASATQSRVQNLQQELPSCWLFKGFVADERLYPVI